MSASKSHSDQYYDKSSADGINPSGRNPYQFIEFRPSSSTAISSGPLHFESENKEEFRTSSASSSLQHDVQLHTSDVSSFQEVQGLHTDKNDAEIDADKKVCSIQNSESRPKQQFNNNDDSAGKVLQSKSKSGSMEVEYDARQGSVDEMGSSMEQRYKIQRACSSSGLVRNNAIERIAQNRRYNNEQHQSISDRGAGMEGGYESQTVYSPTPVKQEKPTSNCTPYYAMRRGVGDHTGVAVAGTLNAQQMAALRTQGFTTGLAKALLENVKVFDHRIWLVDNSGSMQLFDGTRIITSSSPPKASRKSGQTRHHHHTLRGGSSDVVQSVRCTRWEEIQDTVRYHAQMAALMQSPTIFRLLNDAVGSSSVQSNQFSVAEGADQLQYEQEVQNAFRVMQSVQPGGVTPITEHLLGIQRAILERVPELRLHNKKVAVVLATDGLPTDEQGYDGPYVTKKFVSALQQLEQLPVWLVVRLCTNEQAVREFYNTLDERLELSLDVLDDYEEEAHEVFRHNKWLNYALPLHRCRELGYHDRLFDLIDERTLSTTEMRSFCALLFGVENIDDIPEPVVDPRVFLSKIQKLLEDEWEQWHPIKKKMAPWIDTKALEKTYCKKHGMFSSFCKS